MIKARDPNMKYAYPLEVQEDRIFIPSDGSRSISYVLKYCSPTVIQGFTETLFSLSKTGSTGPSTLLAWVKDFNHFARVEKISEITLASVSSYYEYERARSSVSNNFNNLKRLVLTWHSLGHEGVSDDVADFLERIAGLKQNVGTGSRVRSDDPETGWYIDQEYDDLLEAIWLDYETETVDLQKSLTLLLSAQYARRPIQMAHLKIADIIKNGESCGVTGKRIEFPGAKDKNAAGFRQSKQEIHPLSNDLWDLCQLQIQNSRAVWEKSLDIDISHNSIFQLPLFYNTLEPTRKKCIAKAREYEPQPLNVYSSQYLHIQASEISKFCSRRSAASAYHGTTVTSIRTGKVLKENAYRFRYTRPRQLARQGVPRATLQQWIGHSNPKSLEAYYDDPAERARTLNEHIAPLLSPIAQAFQGNLVDAEEHANRGQDPTSRIELEGNEELGVGSCGEHGFCNASVPIPCYRCSKFQPWVYGPHTEVLQRLEERQRIENETPRPGLKRRLLVPVQLDKDIRAVQAVIKLCDERKKKLSK